jgi:hypothetical protein
LKGDEINNNKASAACKAEGSSFYKSQKCSRLASARRLVRVKR